MAVTALRTIQLGRETTWGTAVAATAKLMAVSDATITPVDETLMVKEISSLAPSLRAVQAEQSGKGKIKATLSYEDALFYLHGVFGQVTPTGGGPSYTWSYAAPLASTPTAQSYTVEFYSGTAAYQMSGTLFSKVTFKCQAGGVWQVDADLIGKTVSIVSPASLADRSVNIVRAADTTIYLDAWSGTIGATEMEATLISAELVIDSHKHLKAFLSGSLNPVAFGNDRYDGVLKMTLEFNSNAKSLVDALLTPALVQRQIRLAAASGSLSMTLDFAGTLSNGVELFSDRDGNVTVETTWNGTYNSALANWCRAGVVNNLSVLP